MCCLKTDHKHLQILYDTCMYSKSSKEDGGVNILSLYLTTLTYFVSLLVEIMQLCRKI
jgi:hypothetical protein